MASNSDFEKKSFQLGTMFKPGTPINRVDLFAGRMRQVQDVVDAINQDAHHAVLFGEPGVGKTSLASIISAKLKGIAQYIVAPHINCTGQDAFSEIWKKVFLETKDIIEQKELDLPHSIVEMLTEQTRPEITLTSDDVRRITREIGSKCLLITIIDEFNTTEFVETRQAMADTLKFLADKNVPVTVILIGVADDVEGLIAQHQSTERCLIQIPMPRMSVMELSSVVTTCLGLVEMTIDGDALKSIAYISKGLPHYAHLLGLHAGREALRHQSLNVTKEHVRNGIRSAIDKVQASVQATYRDAVSTSRKDAQYREVLLACALAQTDEFGYFAPVDVREPLSSIKKNQTKIEAYARHLHAFSTSERGPVLKRKIRGTKRPRFRFVNPLVQPYILLRGVNEKLITDEELEKATTVSENDPSSSGLLF